MEQVRVDGMHVRYLPFDIVQTLSKTFASIRLHDRDSLIYAFALARHVSLEENAYFAKLSRNNNKNNGPYLN